MAFLVKERGVDAGMKILISSPECVLGRQNDCDIHEFFDGNDRVSRRHAKIYEKQGVFYVEDLKSRNGTMVNGCWLKESEQLESGDQIEICGIRFRFHDQTDSDLSSASRNQLARTVFEEDDSSLAIMASIPLDGSSSRADSQLASSDRKLEGLIKLLEGLSASIQTGSSESIQIERLLDNLLEGLLRIFAAADRGFVGLRNLQDEPLAIRAVRFRKEESDQPVRISRTIADRVLKSQQVMLSTDVLSDANFAGSESLMEDDIRSFMCAPLVNTQGTAIGIVQLETLSPRRQFSPQDLGVLAAVIPQVSLSLNFSALHESELKRVALDRDLDLARRVQLGLLPDKRPELSGYDFYDFYEAAFHVGGDYFDYVPLRDNRLAVVIADVSGKGVSASLLMAKMAGELKLLLANTESPAEAVSQLNDSMCSSAIRGRFVTLVVAVIDVESHQVTIVNGGHLSPQLRRKSGEVREIGAEERCVCVGILPDQEYRQYQIVLEPGDSITMFTDGFSEAMSTTEDFYGEQRLKEQLGKPARDLTQLGQNVLSDLQAFVGRQSQSDDMCLVSFARCLDESD